MQDNEPNIEISKQGEDVQAIAPTIAQGTKEVPEKSKSPPRYANISPQEFVDFIGRIPGVTHEMVDLSKRYAFGTKKTRKSLSPGKTAALQTRARVNKQQPAGEVRKESRHVPAPIITSKAPVRASQSTGGSTGKTSSRRPTSSTSKSRSRGRSGKRELVPSVSPFDSCVGYPTVTNNGAYNDLRKKLSMCTRESVLEHQREYMHIMMTEKFITASWKQRENFMRSKLIVVYQDPAKWIATIFSLVRNAVRMARKSVGYDTSEASIEVKSSDAVKNKLDMIIAENKSLKKEAKTAKKQLLVSQAPVIPQQPQVMPIIVPQIPAQIIPPPVFIPPVLPPIIPGPQAQLGLPPIIPPIVPGPIIQAPPPPPPSSVQLAGIMQAVRDRVLRSYKWWTGIDNLFIQTKHMMYPIGTLPKPVGDMRGDQFLGATLLHDDPMLIKVRYATCPTIGFGYDTRIEIPLWWFFGSYHDLTVSIELAAHALASANVNPQQAIDVIEAKMMASVNIASGVNLSRFASIGGNFVATDTFQFAKNLFNWYMYKRREIMTVYDEQRIRDEIEDEDQHFLHPAHRLVAGGRFGGTALRRLTSLLYRLLRIVCYCVLGTLAIRIGLFGAQVAYRLVYMCLSPHVPIPTPQILSQRLTDFAIGVVGGHLKWILSGLMNSVGLCLTGVIKICVHSHRMWTQALKLGLEEPHTPYPGSVSLLRFGLNPEEL